MKKSNMSGALYRLIYYSRNVMHQAPPGIGLDDEVRTILNNARNNNKANNITGALLVTALGYAQVLEGARDIVERTFDQICADPRHSDVTVLSFTPTERRSFPEWPMGFSAQVTGIDPLEPLLGDVTATGPRATTGSDVLRLLEKAVHQEDTGVAA